MSGFCHFGLVYSWFCDRALTLPSCLVFLWARSFECARAARSLVCMLCFMLERSVRIPALMSCSGSVLESCQGSDTHSPCSVLLWERAVSSSLFSPPVCSSLPSSFAPYLFSLCLQSCASSLSYDVCVPCVLPCSASQSSCQFVSPTG